MLCSSYVYVFTFTCTAFLSSSHLILKGLKNSIDGEKESKNVSFHFDPKFFEGRQEKEKGKEEEEKIGISQSVGN